MNLLPYSLFVFFIVLTPMLSSAQSHLSQDELIGKGSPGLIERNGYRLRPEAAKAFDEMRQAALKEGIDFQIVSSYRSYDHQNRIWERKFKNYTAQGNAASKAIDRIIEYSTIPGTSRHHWGTDLDLIDANGKTSGDVLVASKFHGDGPFCRLKEWMDKNANRFGFYLVYTRESQRKGFNYEPWHYSFKALSQGYLEQYKQFDIAKVLKNQNLMGAEEFSEAFIKRYREENVLDINPSLLPVN